MDRPSAPHPLYLKKSPGLAIAVPVTFVTASCLHNDESLFYSYAKGEERQIYEQRLAKARRICNNCPVFSTCQDQARGLPAGSRFGIWAGRDVHLNPHLNSTTQNFIKRSGL